MNEDVKDTWYNDLRCWLSYQVAKLYQNSWPVLHIPFGGFWMDLLWHLSNCLSPFPTEEGCLNPVMVEVIRERMGISQEEFNQKIEEIHSDNERKSLGLPPRYSNKA
jgi:hypothetical protein